MADTSQSYGSHRRFLPIWHYFVVPVLLINVVMSGVQAVRYPILSNWWLLLVSVALFLGIFASRWMPLRTQDRLIRFEERTRLAGLLPPEQRGRINELKESQLVALRFAPDDEVPELTRRCLAGELKTPNDIKRAIKNWRADHFRV